MGEREPVVLELDSETIWTLGDDRKTLTLNMVVPAVEGLSQPLALAIDFDRESVERMIERLLRLHAQMELSPWPPS